MKPVLAVAPLLWSNAVLPSLGLGIRGRTLVNAAFATAFGLVAQRATDTPPWLDRRGRYWGAIGAMVPVAAFAVRGSRSSIEHVLLHIPLGTVYSEELIFRKSLQPLLGVSTTAVVFGLWHVRGADDVPTTVAATTAAGLLFGWLQRRTGSVLAPAMVHLSINVGGVVATRPARTKEN